jgi:hypothetical protein
MRRPTFRAHAVHALPFVLLPVLALAAAGCGDDNNSSNGSNTAPSVMVTETFSGSVALNSGTTFPFSVSTAGAVTATFKSMSPDTGATMGLALGVWNGASCNVIIANDNAKVATTVAGQSSASGNLCVRAYDLGRLTAPQLVEISITHF